MSEVEEGRDGVGWGGGAVRHPGVSPISLLAPPPPPPSPPPLHEVHHKPLLCVPHYRHDKRMILAGHDPRLQGSPQFLKLSKFPRGPISVTHLPPVPDFALELDFIPPVMAEPVATQQ